MKPKVRIIVDDALHALKQLPAESADCIVTSPPYFRLRDYGVTGQIGLEPNIGEYVDRLVVVFRECRRVLKSQGTLWLVLGDTYSSHRTMSRPTKPRGGFPDQTVGESSSVPLILKPKDLCGVPWRVALALQADGWYLRSDIVWHKTNCFPETARDRCTRAHEYVFMLTRSPRYYFDKEAVQEPAVSKGRVRPGPWQTHRWLPQSKSPPRSGRLVAFRNKRTVWPVALPTYRGRHPATFPEALVEPCVLAGCPRGGTVLDPFAGSGTTLAVASSLGRHAIGIELNPDYVPVMRGRLEKYAARPSTRVDRPR